MGFCPQALHGHISTGQAPSADVVSGDGKDGAAGEELMYLQVSDVDPMRRATRFGTIRFLWSHSFVYLNPRNAWPLSGRFFGLAGENRGSVQSRQSVEFPFFLAAPAVFGARH